MKRRFPTILRRLGEPQAKRPWLVSWVPGESVRDAHYIIRRADSFRATPFGVVSFGLAAQRKAE